MSEVKSKERAQRLVDKVRIAIESRSHGIHKQVLQSVALFLSQTDEFDRSSSEVARLIKKLSQSLENTNEVSSIVALWEAYDWLTFEKRVIASTTEELRALSRRVSRQIEKRERPKRLL